MGEEMKENKQRKSKKNTEEGACKCAAEKA